MYKKITLIIFEIKNFKKKKKRDCYFFYQTLCIIWLIYFRLNQLVVILQLKSKAFSRMLEDPTYSVRVVADSSLQALLQ